MKENKRPFCVRYCIFIAALGISFQLVLPQTGFCSTGARVPVSGERLVREQLSHGESASRMKPGMKAYVIRSGDNFCNILERSGLSKKDALYIAKRANKVYKLSKLKPGTVLELYFSADGTGLQEVDYKVSTRKKVVLYNGKVLTVSRDRNSSAPTGTGRVAASVPNVKAGTAAGKKASPVVTASLKPQHRKEEGAQVFISQPPRDPETTASGMKMYSSYNCGLPQVGYSSPEATYELLSNGLVLSPSLPAWDAIGSDGGSIKREIRDKSNKKLAALKKKKKRKMRDSRLARHSGEYFLRAPLSYRRISSHYSHSRINPITNEEQPHLGIDYSAPSGTPVYSIGPGRVLSNDWSGGYGKTVRILHANGYISQYGHLSRFSRGLKPGKSVRKGETIGYVGMTGRSTGPHLDFRVTYQGAFINPAKVEGKAVRISSSGRTRTRG